MRTFSRLPNDVLKHDPHQPAGIAGCLTRRGGGLRGGSHWLEEACYICVMINERSELPCCMQENVLQLRTQARKLDRFDGYSWHW